VGVGAPAGHVGIHAGGVDVGATPGVGVGRGETPHSVQGFGKHGVGVGVRKTGSPPATRSAAGSVGDAPHPMMASARQISATIPARMMTSWRRELRRFTSAPVVAARAGFASVAGWIEIDVRAVAHTTERGSGVAAAEVDVDDALVLAVGAGLLERVERRGLVLENGGVVGDGLVALDLARETEPFGAGLAAVRGEAERDETGRRHVATLARNVPASVVFAVAGFTHVLLQEQRLSARVLDGPRRYGPPDLDPLAVKREG
jgi:hypothetical protein